MKFLLWFSKKESALNKEYAANHKKSVLKFLHESALEKIEDINDLKIYRHAIKKFKKDSTTFSLDEIEKELGIRENRA